MENNLFEDFMYFEGMLRRYLMWQRKSQGGIGTPHRGQGRVLALLKIQPETTQKELGYLLDMRPQSLGELLGKLEKNEFITREPSEADRRIMLVKLTEKGREAAAKLEEKPENPLFEQLTAEEQVQLQQILAKLTKFMEAELPEDSRVEGPFDMDMRRKMMKAFKSGRHDFRGHGEAGHGPDDCGRPHGRHHHHHHHHFQPPFFDGAFE